MKGFELEYTATIVIAVVVLAVVMSMIMFYYRQMRMESKEIVDVKYACYQYNNTDISIEDFKLLMYGFLTGQCDSVSSTLPQPITFDDIQNAAREVDDKVIVTRVKSCQFPSVNSHSVLVCCGDIENKEVINIKRRKIYNSDVIVCVE